MIKETELIIQPQSAFDKDQIKLEAAKNLNISPEEITAVIPKRRSLDARSREPKYIILSDVYINETPAKESDIIDYKYVTGNRKVIIVGFGPGGMFTALRLIELGIKPVIFERGKDVQLRRRDLRNIQQFGNVDPDSNYCFGEGGAGTYSDGKLYTRSTKRGDYRKILDLLVQHGADEDILIDSHPHIGSNKLPKIVQAIRQTILNCGGEINFNSRVSSFILDEKKIKGVVINDNLEYTADSVILATGHSARDIYYLLGKQKIKIEPKAFAMGVRIEHPQQIIDEIQYHSKVRSNYLPAASYNLVCQVMDRGVFSFCMCPGGLIIPASTSPGELVLNGMSVSRRDSRFANSGMVVPINENDWKKYNEYGDYAGLMYREEVEKMAFEAGGKTQTAPAQRITDFTRNKTSASLPVTSYIPGVISAPLHELLPKQISTRLQQAIILFGKKMKGYFTEEAQILAAETRTSSPIRIPRDKESLMHVEIEGLFPCGEGAGYAGGIVSAAVDGENCANAVSKYINNS